MVYVYMRDRAIYREVRLRMSDSLTLQDGRQQWSVIVSHFCHILQSYYLVHSLIQLLSVKYSDTIIYYAFSLKHHSPNYEIKSFLFLKT